jgi:hypothetical protein
MKPICIHARQGKSNEHKSGNGLDCSDVMKKIQVNLLLYNWSEELGICSGSL